MTRIHFFRAEKLVRDKTQERLKKRNIELRGRIAGDHEYVPLLKKKLLEEAQEVVDAQTVEEYLAECADVLEVIHALTQAHDITMEQIEEKRLQLRDARGGYEQRAYCTYLAVPADNAEGVAYYQARPDHYPEIDEPK